MIRKFALGLLSPGLFHKVNKNCSVAGLGSVAENSSKNEVSFSVNKRKLGHQESYGNQSK